MNDSRVKRDFERYSHEPYSQLISKLPGAKLSGNL